MKSPPAGRLFLHAARRLARPVAVTTGILWGLLLSLLGLLAAPSPARALTALTRDFEGLVARAETIFQGTVVAQESLWVGEGPGRHVATRVTFQVAETYKGLPASSQTLEFMGGTVPGKTVRVPGIPQFAPGETTILFVVGNGVQVCPLVGAFQGRFAVERDAATAQERVCGHDRRPVTRTGAIGQEGEGTVSSDAGAPLTKSAEPGPGATAAEAPALTAAQFGAAILQKLQERRAQGLPEVQRD